MCHLADAAALVDYYRSGELPERERAHDDALKEANRMSLREVRVGARVKLRPAYWKLELRDAVGTVEKVWGEPHYAAVQVRLDGYVPYRIQTVQSSGFAPAFPMEFCW
jgi:hypothetical protein